MKYKNEPHKGKILIINDEPGISKWLAKHLARMQYRPAFVDTLDEANAVLEHVDFDAVMYAHEFLFTNLD